MAKHSLRRLEKDLLWILSVAQIFTTIIILLTLFQFQSYLSDLLSHFLVHYFLFSTLATPIFLWNKYWFRSSTGLIAVIFSGCLLYPYAPVANRSDTSPNEMSFAVINLLTSNTAHSETLKTVAAIDAEVVVLLEVDDAWSDSIAELQASYPFQHHVPRLDNFGLSLISKVPFDIQLARPLAEGQPPIIAARMQFSGKQVLVYGVHTVPPLGVDYYRTRNQQLHKLAEEITQQQTPSILLSDLNTSVWAPSFKRFLSNSTLLDSRKGIGILPSWPQAFIPLQIPIDHILVSPEFEVLSLESFTVPGSDHKGLFARLAFSSSR